MGQIVLHRQARSEPGGRTKRTAQREMVLLGALMNGLTRTAACGAAGISLETLANWLDSDDELTERVEIATNHGEAVLLQRISKAGEEPRHWTANAWILERTRQQRYALRTRAAQEDNTIALPPGLAEEIRRRINEGYRPEVSISSPDVVDAEVSES